MRHRWYLPFLAYHFPVMLRTLLRAPSLRLSLSPAGIVLNQLQQLNTTRIISCKRRGQERCMVSRLHKITNPCVHVKPIRFHCRSFIIILQTHVVFGYTLRSQHHPRMRNTIQSEQHRRMRSIRVDESATDKFTSGTDKFTTLLLSLKLPIAD